QWNYNSAPLNGQTGSSLTLNNIQLSDAGTYSVSVTNLAGSALSSNTVLTVWMPQTNCSTAPTGLVSWWRAEGNALDIAATNNGALLGNVSYGSGMVGEGFVFSGSS